MQGRDGCWAGRKRPGRPLSNTLPGVDCKVNAQHYPFLDTKVFGLKMGGQFWGNLKLFFCWIPVWILAGLFRSCWFPLLESLFHPIIYERKEGMSKYIACNCLFHYLKASSKKTKLTTTSSVWDFQFLHTVGGNQFGISVMETGMEIPWKLKFKIPCSPAIQLLDIKPKQLIRI